MNHTKVNSGHIITSGTRYCINPAGTSFSSLSLQGGQRPVLELYRLCVSTFDTTHTAEIEENPLLGQLNYINNTCKNANPHNMTTRAEVDDLTFLWPRIEFHRISLKLLHKQLCTCCSPNVTIPPEQSDLNKYMVDAVFSKLKLSSSARVTRLCSL